MKVWIEKEKDVFNYFYFFNNEKNNITNNIPKMSVVSINASNINGIESKKEFIERCKDEINTIYTNNVLNNFKFYLFINQEIVNIQSKVEKYMKIWRKINRKINITGFILGKEIIIQKDGKYFFSSIAEIPIKYLDIAIEIVSYNPQKCALFMSEFIDIDSGEYTKELFDKVFDNNNNFYEINYFLFTIKCCSEGNIALRYGTTFEEAEIALVYNSEQLKI